VDVSNPGTFTETFNVTLVSDLDGTIGTPQSSGALAPGGSTTVNFSWTTGTVGTHTLTATAAHDPVDGGTDSNVANDSANTTADVTVVTTVADVDVNITGDGGTCQAVCIRPVEVTVSNSGPDAIDSVTVSLSSDLDGLLDTNSTGQIISGGSVILILDWTIDGTTSAGRHDLTAVTVPDDLGGQDPDPTNNTDTRTSKQVN
jgi:hypothetical protein